MCRCLNLLSNILTLVLMLVGGIMVVNGQMTMGDLVAVNGYLWDAHNAASYGGLAYAMQMQRFTTSVEKIYNTYIAEPDVKKPLNPRPPQET